jgi:hypothetical protein
MPCMREWNRSFMSPTSIDKAELRDTLRLAMGTLPRDLADLVTFSVRPHLDLNYQ